MAMAIKVPVISTKPADENVNWAVFKKVPVRRKEVLFTKEGRSYEVSRVVGLRVVWMWTDGSVVEWVDEGRRTVWTDGSKWEATVLARGRKGTLVQLDLAGYIVGEHSVKLPPPARGPIVRKGQNQW